MRSAARCAAAVLAAVVSLGVLGCSDPVREAPKPVLPVTPEVLVVAPPASAASTSVPDAASVLGTTSGAKPDPAGGRTNKTMSRAEESVAMPMPGQNNDHSAPLPPTKRASGP